MTKHCVRGGKYLLNTTENAISETLNFKISLDVLALKNLCFWCEFQSHLLFITSLLPKNVLTALIIENSMSSYELYPLCWYVTTQSNLQCVWWFYYILLCSEPLVSEHINMNIWRIFWSQHNMHVHGTKLSLLWNCKQLHVGLFHNVDKVILILGRDPLWFNSQMQLTLESNH